MPEYPEGHESPQWPSLQLNLISTPGEPSFQHAAQLPLHFTPSTSVIWANAAVRTRASWRYSFILYVCRSTMYPEPESPLSLAPHWSPLRKAFRGIGEGGGGVMKVVFVFFGRGRRCLFCLSLGCAGCYEQNSLGMMGRRDDFVWLRGLPKYSVEQEGVLEEVLTIRNLGER